MELKRVATFLSPKLNDWLDERSQSIGISKSALIALAVDNAYKESVVVDKLPQMMEQIEELKKSGVIK